MGSKVKLVAPKNLTITFKPSPKQYEVWKALSPECPECGGGVIMVHDGYDEKGNEQMKPQCDSCGLEDIPKLILAGGSAG